jgi:transcriptional regulator with XRE-family HTH domain
MSTIHDERYVKLISSLKEIRKSKGITQQQLAKLLSQPQPYIAKTEQLERRLDLIELFDWLNALKVEMSVFLHSAGFLNEKDLSTSIPALPIPCKVTSTHNGISLSLAWQGKEVSVILEGITSQQYLEVERDITRIYRALNEKTNSTKNREVICEALELAVSNLPNLNPSDIYQHIVYRLYLREYNKTQADRSWVRAGGEALELFVQRHYSHTLNSHGILIKSLLSNNDEIQALKDMN